MKNNNRPDIELSMKFLCPKCHFSKIISRKTINSIKTNEFQNNSLFKCDKCSTEMHPYQVIADFKLIYHFVNEFNCRLFSLSQYFILTIY